MSLCAATAAMATSAQIPREPGEIALEYVRARASELGLTAADVEDVVVSSEAKSGHTGVSHVYLRQRHRGIPVWGADITVNIARDGKVVGHAGEFVSGLSGNTTPTLTAPQAFEAAARHLALKPTEPIRIVSAAKGAEQKTVLSDGGVSSKPVPVELAFFPMSPGTICLAWQVEIEEKDGEHWWVALVDAHNGALLNKIDRVTQGNKT
jgi:extracellular elastinolytic metalloproteinase